MDTAVRAWLISQLGTDTDLTDLEQRYTRLGTARAVALEILRERLAALRAQPSVVNVSSVVGVNYTANITSYERQIAALEAGEPPAPDDPTDPDGSGDGFGLVYLVERPRR
ncbi:hypothetical protein OH809_45050 (plasmid) [Streptomyces sp. NBC_00873]|uniref:hypothetical protein n=1 Tax=unclassified Streptomyces TaxID=2593676 RepID=UPI002F915F7D|nr:hypothetical protein OH809_45050 [Streptomyces sp. NBC_00873]WTA49427.1 hypothetical protein OH821_45070 [Streptomyces sp. NBC_00842]